MNRSAFTLLETILALALSALVLIAVGMAIDINLRMLDAGRTRVEEAQLARAILQRMADDLRNAVQYDPIDTSTLIPGGSAGERSIEGTSDEWSQGDGGSLVEAGGADSPGTELEGDEFDLPESETTEDLAASAEPPAVPGLYGNSCQLQIDTSRLPRIDEYQQLVSSAQGTTDADRLSDVKTVAYYALSDEQGGSLYGTGASAGSYGLVRRQLDRATAAWSAGQGQLFDVADLQDVLAPEVAAVEFRYFDGTEWYEEWDSAQAGGLPLAVEICLAVISKRQRGEAGQTSQTASGLSSLAEDQEVLIYRLLVHLPTAQPATESLSSYPGEMGEAASTGPSESAEEPSP